MSTLATHGISKRYGSRRVVNGVSLTVRTGEVAGLLGPNGAGKTTCFYMIVGLVPCGEGSIMLDDTDITGQPMHIRARHGLGYLPQEASVFRKLSVADNILAVLEIRKGLNRQQRMEILDSLLHELHIGHLREQKAASLSGGERRRVEIARALAVEPQIIGHLRDRGIGILITDHNVRETLGICDHAYILNEGQVISAGPPQAILADEQVRSVYLGSDFRM